MLGPPLQELGRKPAQGQTDQDGPAVSAGVDADSLLDRLQSPPDPAEQSKPAVRVPGLASLQPRHLPPLPQLSRPPPPPPHPRPQLRPRGPRDQGRGRGQQVLQPRLGEPAGGSEGGGEGLLSLILSGPAPGREEQQAQDQPDHRH